MLLKIGFGYTRLCNFSCEFCYSKHVRGTWRRDEALRVIQDAIDHYGNNIDLNWGTGENILVPDFIDVLREAHRLGVSQDITTNGSLILKKEAFNYLDELDVSFDYPDPELHNKSRRHPKAFEWASQTVKYASNLGLQVSIAIVGMRGNMTYENGIKMVELARSLGAEAIRLNLYFHTKPDEFVPSLTQISEFIKGLKDAGATLHGTSDPAIARILKVEPVGYLGSVRLLPEKKISPSTYLTTDEWIAPIELPNFYKNFLKSSAYKRFEEVYKKSFPKASADRVAVLGYDPYVEGEVETISMRQAPSKHFIHLGYLPTTIFGV